MTDIERLKRLQLALRVVGLFAILGFYPSTLFWPSGWAWSSGRSEYLGMILAIYATLGVFLLIAARNPNQHLGLVSFAIWSSLVHGVVMAVQAVQNPTHIRHLYGDVPALLIVAAVLAFLSPQALRLPFARSAP
jgi:FtsH-binding integral membrane protein